MTEPDRPMKSLVRMTKGNRTLTSLPFDGERLGERLGIHPPSVENRPLRQGMNRKHSPPTLHLVGNPGWL